MKKIMIIDDSALMRRVMSDIIHKKAEYKVVYNAGNGVEALAYLEKDSDIDAIICDLNMPKMTGLEFLKVMNTKPDHIPVIMFSSSEDSRETITALELGAMDFIKKPNRIFSNDNEDFERKIFNALEMASGIKERHRIKKGLTSHVANVEEIKKPAVSTAVVTPVKRTSSAVESKGKNKLVALVCSTGGPKALQSVIPKLPKNLNAPMVLVQHMPAGFTQSLASRLDDLSKISVKEAEEGEILQKGTVYIAKGGTHLGIKAYGDDHRIYFDETPPVVGLKPCGNIMYNSIVSSKYDEIICVVLTGMGADGTKGINELSRSKKIYVIAQDEESSTVYGMPKAIYEKGLTDEVLDLNLIADAITKKVGVY